MAVVLTCIFILAWNYFFLTHLPGVKEGIGNTGHKALKVFNLTPL